MTTNRLGRRTVISQNKRGTVSKATANLKMARVIMQQQEVFKETVILFKKVVAEYYGTMLPDDLWGQIAARTDEARANGQANTWADMDILVRKVVGDYKITEIVKVTEGAE